MGRITGKGLRGQGKTLHDARINQATEGDNAGSHGNRETSGVGVDPQTEPSGQSESLSKRYIVGGKIFTTAKAAMEYMERI